MLSAIKELARPSVLTEIAKAVFSITTERFVVAADNYARANPKKMHHVYEWGQIGLPSGRLFVMERQSVLNGMLVINTNFLPSRLPVPINPELLIPSRTGKVVSSRSIFAEKATVMEEGRSVSFVAKKILAFVGSDGMVFIKPGKQINILNPGGKGVKNAFAEFMLSWYLEHGTDIMNSSGLYERIANDVSIELSKNGSNINTVRRAVANIVQSSDLDRAVIR